MNSKKLSLAILKITALVAMASMYLLSICYQSAEIIRDFTQVAIAQIEKSEPAPSTPLPALLPSIQLPDILSFLPKHQAIINQLPRTYLTVKHLKQWAKEIGIRNYSKKPKAELITLLTPSTCQSA